MVETAGVEVEAGEALTEGTVVRTVGMATLVGGKEAASRWLRSRCGISHYSE